MIRGERGVFWPQNGEYTRTNEMVKYIAEAVGHKIFISKAFNCIVCMASHIQGKIGGRTDKAFGNMIYDQSMSTYDFEYRKVGLRESIKETERND